MIYTYNMLGSVVVIGGANMDINGFPQDPLNTADSNPGKVEYCPGGVGRNIAENLHRLGVDVRFIGVIGDDPGGQLLTNSSNAIGLNIKHSLFLSNEPQVTSVYIALMESNGEMKLALSDMGILDKLTEEHLESKASLIKESSIVVLDANLPESMICFILDRFGKGKAPLFFLDTVSGKKAPQAATRIGSFDTIKLGRMEAEAVSGVTIPNITEMALKTAEEKAEIEEKLKESANAILSKGTRRVFITMGKEGVYTASKDKSFFSPVQYVQPVNTSGGGDAFMAGIVYGTLNDWDEETIIAFSMAMGRITVQNKSTVSPEMSLDLALKSAGL